MTQVNEDVRHRSSRYDGTDYVCRTCNSEIMVKHRGDEAKGLRPQRLHLHLRHADAAGAWLGRPGQPLARRPTAAPGQRDRGLAMCRRG